MASLEGKTKTVNFEVEVLAVKKQVLPELTDEWVKDTLGFDDVADLRERVADSIKEQKEDVLPRMKKNACLIELAKRLDVEVPAAVQEQTEAKLLQDFFSQLQNQGASFDMYLQQNGITADQFKADVKQQAADTAKQDMALDAWVAHFELKVTDEEVLEEFEKSGAKDPKALLKEWREGGRLHLVREALLRTHAVLDVMEKAKVTEHDPAEEAEAEKKAAKKSSKEGCQERGRGCRRRGVASRPQASTDCVTGRCICVGPVFMLIVNGVFATPCAKRQAVPSCEARMQFRGPVRPRPFESEAFYEHRTCHFGADSLTSSSNLRAVSAATTSIPPLKRPHHLPRRAYR